MIGSVYENFDIKESVEAIQRLLDISKKPSIKIPKLIDRSKLDIKIKETKVKQIKL